MNRTGLWLTLATVSSALVTESYAQTTTRVEETHPSVSFTGNWQTIAHPSASGGTLAIANEAGARVDVTFTGTGIAWIGHQCPCGSYARIYIDGQYRGYGYSYDAATRGQQDLYWFDGLAEGTHVLTVEATGDPTSGSTDTYIGIDAFDIGNPLYSSMPMVTITSPPANSQVTGVVTVNAEVTDNAGIAGVRFYAEDSETGTSKFIGEDTTAPYSITRDTSSIPHAKSYGLWAIASDHVGNHASSDHVPIIIAHGGHTDFTRPFVEMTAPANDSIVTGLVTISAEGYDNVGIARVEFRVRELLTNTVWILTDTTAPYSITADTSGIPSGREFAINATAYDAASNSFTATNGVRVTVQH